jgi:hypothetical protein
MAHLPNLSQPLSSAQVVIRFCLRMTVVVAFAAIGGNGFGKSFAALLWMSVIFSAVVGTLKWERPFDRVLNHWDETVAYLALCYLVGGLNQAGPI